ncbi:YciI family protein [Dactylosporangium sucinum]|uniref:Transcription initiation protein n=1 Tax=Dactylosporangium sucinum TaxID=1424081 RepID=A0A917TKE3_9ACTN|nr:YciI family protein [Dactylosporangium sucinum]GGM25742.1 transcription initiation protein [Dactylosporangium sucinum]
MPQYAILIYEAELPGGVADIPPDVMEANLRAGDEIAAMGVRVVNEQALQPSRLTRTVRAGGLVTDGPFLESKEVLAGFFVVEAQDFDQAVAVARLLPIMDGAVEVRPLLTG